MNPQHSYFGFTTAQQRKLLFEIWEKTGCVSEACRKAHVGRATFYYWKPRFTEKGYGGLETFESRAAHQLNRKAAAIEVRVVAMRQAQPGWGKLRIADELAKENNWVPMVSANTVRRILMTAGLWPEQPKPGRKKASLPDQSQR